MGLLSKNRDFSLISRILNDNDRDAADELVTQYYKAVYKHIYIKLKDEELSMDLTQETFISARRAMPGATQSRTCRRLPTPRPPARF